MSTQHIPLKGIYRALIPSFVAKNQGVRTVKAPKKALKATGTISPRYTVSPYPPLLFWVAGGVQAQT